MSLAAAYPRVPGEFALFWELVSICADFCVILREAAPSNKNNRAWKAWFWLEDETFRSTARKLKNPLTSSMESRAGSLLLVNAWNFRVHERYASRIFGK
jgi:hypothetical protein